MKLRVMVRNLKYHFVAAILIETKFVYSQFQRKVKLNKRIACR